MAQPFAVEGTVGIEATLIDGNVAATRGQALKIDIGGFLYDIGGLRGAYDGAVAQSVDDDDTSYVYLDRDAALQINTTGYPTTITYIALARVVAANGEIAAIYNEKVLLAASSSVVGTCLISYPVDGDVRGGGTSASSNNDFGALRYDYASDGWNRINRRPPQNYTSGDLIMRLLCSIPSTTSGSTKWVLEWAFRNLTDALDAYDDSDTQVFDLSSQASDALFSLDLTIPSDDFSKGAALMFLKLTRLATDVQDDCGIYIYVHDQELRYTGFQLAGQAGQ